MPRKGRWAKGESGNQAGRPPGTPDKRSQLRALISAEAPELVATAVRLAKDGDVAALNLLLARCISPLRPTSDPITFELPRGASLADQARSILAGIAAGQIDPITGKALVDAVAAVANVTALDEIERRLAALETGESPHDR
jgi:hypothetical protein